MTGRSYRKSRRLTDNPASRVKARAAENRRTRQSRRVRTRASFQASFSCCKKRYCAFSGVPMLNVPCVSILCPRLKTSASRVCINTQDSARLGSNHRRIQHLRIRPDHDRQLAPGNRKAARPKAGRKRPSRRRRVHESVRAAEQEDAAGKSRGANCRQGSQDQRRRRLQRRSAITAPAPAATSSRLPDRTGTGRGARQRHCAPSPFQA